ncbi:MAG: hypothetical protein ACXABY_26360 [Candidatus Thorarchaeota archaeon]|jgi:hypothetical protein
MKDIDLTELERLCEGVYKKNDKTFYVLCAISQKPCYCNNVRLDKLIQRYGSVEAVGQQYESRDGKRLKKEGVGLKKQQKMDASRLKEKANDIRTKKKREKAHRKKRRDARSSVRRCSYFVTESDKNAYVLFEGDKMCMMPRLFRGQGGCCNGCKWFRHCTFEQKHWHNPGEDEEACWRPEAIKAVKLRHFDIRVTGDQNINRTGKEKQKLYFYTDEEFKRFADTGEYEPHNEEHDTPHETINDEFSWCSPKVAKILRRARDRKKRII